MVRGAVVVALLYVFLVAVNGLGAGFRALGEGVLDSFFAATENPFVGLMIGILATTLVQSSSVTTAMIVGLVAAPENPIPVANAVDLPPKAVPPRVLVQAPPFGWGVVQEAEVG